MTRVAYVSTYVPKKCGLATYTFHLRQALSQENQWSGTDKVVVISSGEEDVGSPDPSLLPLARNSKEEYAKMARRLNRSEVDVVSLQHEFGIFGGEAGAYILEFVRNLRKPLVTTFHTVFEDPQPPYASIQREIAEKSTKIIVMNRKAIPFLHQSFGIPVEKICFIPHGAPVPQHAEREQYRQELGWSSRKVMMTFGLLNRGKGIELIIKTLPDIVKRVPDVLYAIVGQTHPEVRKWEGEKYREELLAQINANHLDDHVVMIDEYMDERNLVKHITACDLYITPYPGMQQITSGTLAYAVGLGRPVLTTPYSYAQDLFSRYPELLIRYSDDEAWAEKIVSLLANEQELSKWEGRMEELGRELHWQKVGRQHATLFAEVKDNAIVLR
ncbi:glycosyltransferase family 4 protein [Brevibacillus massiliensis]|uniref:glycosyltransferase family 4 protein n=1 Tax=Brevibacillus massiliensis TaxID=1118054 RepID=UPI0002E77190|nr:glycosyltransferase family 4 protein [Brevibacillus massiliensis]